MHAIKKGNLTHLSKKKKKPDIKTYYPQLLCPNTKMLHIPIDDQILVLIAFSRYICLKKKLAIIIS